MCDAIALIDTPASTSEFRARMPSYLSFPLAIALPLPCQKLQVPYNMTVVMKVLKSFKAWLNHSLARPAPLVQIMSLLFVAVA